MQRLPRAFLAAAFLCASPAIALTPDRELTQYVHRIWQTQQGLPDGAIVRILQDPTGYLWLATEAGLHRFDGVRFTPAERLMSGAPANLYIRAAAQDASGTMWLGGNDSKVYAVRSAGTVTYTQEQGLPGGLMQCMVPETSGIVWTCMERGLARIDPANTSQPIQVFRAADGLASDNARAVCETSEGVLWIGGDTPRVTERVNGGFKIHALNGIPPAASVRSLLCDGDTLWVGTTFGLVRIQSGQQRLFTTKDGLVDDFVFSLSKGAQDTLWVGTRSGFSRLHKDIWDSFSPEDGLSQSTAQTVLEDREGNLWVGTKRGLNQFTDGRSVPYTAAEGLPSNETGPVLQDTAGVIWAGTLDAGIARFDGRRFTKLTTADGLPSNVVRAMAEDVDRSLWIGTANGLARISGGRVTARYSAANGLPSSDIRSLFRDRDGVVWIGTAAGLASLTGARLTIVASAPHREIRSIGQDRDGSVVVGTDEGIYINEDGAFRPLTQGGVYMRNANAFFLDRDGLLWVGLNGAGLRLIDGGKVTAYFTRDGLYDAELYGISVDEQDRMWIACSRGIFWVARGDLRRFAAGEIDHVNSVSYSPTEAQRVIESRPGVQPALWRMKDGRMWFSTVHGLIALDPAQPAREGPPPIVIEDPVVNGAVTAPQQISQLPGGQRNITFTYAGLSYALPELIRFRYRLEGYDADWIDAGTRREAFYTNLPPGDYRFQVTGCNFDGPCNQTGAVIAFTLAPLLYERVWFWPLMILLLGGMALLAYQLHIRRLRERYDLIVSERSRIARELHDTLIQGFSGITMALQALTARVQTPSERETLQDIISDAATCLRETRQSVAGLRAMPGSTGSQHESGFASALSRAVREITETKGLRTKLDLDKVTRDLPPEVEYQVLRIVREAVNNSVKHAGADEIAVSLRANPDALAITIRDDGCGFSSEETTAGPGHYGIIGMKERASQVGATLDLVTKPGAGTAITLTLPTSV
jgi:signal transduction histidine kinase/ligand-binding sensor domain-containing protein